LWLTLVAIILLVTQTGPVIGVSVDNPFPNPGDTITITVCACMVPQGWNESLWLSIDRPDGHNLYYGELNATNATMVYKIPQDAPGGLYTVTVFWDHNYVETGFTVEDQGQPIPEFPLPLAVLFVAFTAATLAVLGRQATARSKTLATHS
jgi:hypothetical protein